MLLFIKVFINKFIKNIISAKITNCKPTKVTKIIYTFQPHVTWFRATGFELLNSKIFTAEDFPASYPTVVIVINQSDFPVRSQ